ncbi:MAG: hypothetical protein Q9208_003565 [Pyrenodesmia sp. 3 TL-2023]
MRRDVNLVRASLVADVSYKRVTRNQITQSPLSITEPTDSAVHKDATRTEAHSADFKKAFQMVIHLPHDECAQRICYLDTGSTFDVVSHQVVESLRLKKDIHQRASPSPDGDHFLGPEPRVTFDWHIAEHRKTYTTTFVVSHDTELGDFDVLLGSTTIQQIGFYTTGSLSSLRSTLDQAPRPATPCGSANAANDWSRPEHPSIRYTSYPAPQTRTPDFEGVSRPRMKPTSKRKRRSSDDAGKERTKVTRKHGACLVCRIKKKRCLHVSVDPEPTRRSPGSPAIAGGIVEDTLSPDGERETPSREGRPDNNQADAEAATQPLAETDGTSISASANSEDKAIAQAVPQTAIPWIRETCKIGFASQSNLSRRQSR